MWYKFKRFTVQFGYGLAMLSILIGFVFLPPSWPLILNGGIYYLCAKSISKSLYEETNKDNEDDNSGGPRWAV